jgi:hypothetical protein
VLIIYGESHLEVRVIAGQLSYGNVTEEARQESVMMNLSKSTKDPLVCQFWQKWD